MENNPQQPAGGGQVPVFPARRRTLSEMLQQHKSDLRSLWEKRRKEIENVDDLKRIGDLPIARIKKIMKADEDVRMIAAEAPALISKACELFIFDLSIRSWTHVVHNKRRTLQRYDVATAIVRNDAFDFLVDIVPKPKPASQGLGVGPGVGLDVGPDFGLNVGPDLGLDDLGLGVGTGGMPIGSVGPLGPVGSVGPVCSVGPSASGLPYYCPPLGQPAPPGVMTGRAAVDPAIYMQAPLRRPPSSHTWVQSVWQTTSPATDEAIYASGSGRWSGSGRRRRRRRGGAARSSGVDRGNVAGQG